MTNKRGRPFGTAKDDSLDGRVTFRCRRGDKGRWVQVARKQGKTLSDWIINIANERIRDEN